ncbi:MAG: glycosyltransferase [Candidatus Binatia bacterium]
MRIFRIIDRLNVGGPAKHVAWLEAGLRERGIASKLITGVVAEGEGDMAYFAAERGVEPLVVPEMSREIGASDLRAIIKVYREMRRFQPDVVHTHKSKAGAVGRLAALLYRWARPAALLLRPRRCSVVHTFHGHTFYGYFGPVRSRIYRAIERALARVATDRIVVVSEQQRREIGERFGIGHAEQYRVVPLGIEVGAVASDSRGILRRELGLGDDQILLGVVGRLCEVKNHEMLLQAFARLDGDAWLAVIGDGELRERLQSLAGRLGIAARVVFLGFRRDVLSLYAALDVACLTSKNEGTPVTLIEAMTASRPIAATAVGGVVDILGERQVERNGFTVWSHGASATSGDVEGFARALAFLIERPALRAEMGRAGNEFGRQSFSKERLVDDIVELYEDLVVGAAKSKTPHEGAASVSAAPPPHRDDRAASVRASPSL